MTKQRISKMLYKSGMAWAVSSRKYLCADHQCCNFLDGDKPAYHIHPDASYPHVNHIKKFYSLKEIAEYVATAKRAAAANDCVEADSIMSDFWASLE